MMKQKVLPALASANNTTDTRLIGEFSEMVSEVKTLIRVINESSESKENFEMLFRLIIQKYTRPWLTPATGSRSMTTCLPKASRNFLLR
jgi:hypothetical protein